MPSNWPSSLAPGSSRPRRDWPPGTTSSIWAPQTQTGAFDPFADASTWSARPSANLLFPPPKKELLAPEDASPEHISMMLRNLGITPSPGASPALTNLVANDPPVSPLTSTPPTLSPTTQIMSLGSNSTVHTPTPTRAVDPLFTPTLLDQASFTPTPIGPPLFTPTPEMAKGRLGLSNLYEESGPRSRGSTGGASNPSQPLLPPRHGGPGIQIQTPIVNSHERVIQTPVTNSHERVVSWMQRQGLSSAQTSPAMTALPTFVPGITPVASPRQDWVAGSPQAPMVNLNALPSWDRPVTGMRPQNVAGSMWAPQPPRPSANVVFSGGDERKTAEQGLNEPVNFLRLLQPTSQPPYGLFVMRIVKNSDQQASIFLQQKLKAAITEEARKPIIDAIVEQGFEMMTNRFGNWAVQRCLEAPCTLKERRRVAEVMKGRVIELATNCYGTHVVQKALDCTEAIQMMVVSEMLQGDLAATLMNKHASHVWTKIMELSWSDPAPPIFDYVNKAMQGRWADLARHETGSLIVQHAFENLGEADKSDCVREVLDSIGRLATDQWGSWVVQHLLENGTEADRAQAVAALVEHIPNLALDPQGMKVIEKAVKSGGPQAVDKITRRMSEPARSGRRPLIVDLALGATGSQLVSTLLPMLNKAQWSILHDSVKGHIVTLKGSKSGSRIVWLFERTKAQHNAN